jgi:glycerol uptake facilitator-like aquaporin
VQSRRPFVAEFLATAALAAAVVGSGVMAERLTNDTAVALLANSVATGAALAVLILIFAPISGAHMNPAVTLMDAATKHRPWRDVPLYSLAQIAGAFAGVAVIAAMFELPAFEASSKVRAGLPQLFSESVASFGLILVIRGCTGVKTGAVALAVAGYIVAAYWWTASTSFANPALTLARAATDTFAGVRPEDAPGFIAAQLLGAGAGTVVGGWLFAAHPADAPKQLKAPRA